MQLTGTVASVSPMQTGTSSSGNEWKKNGFMLNYKDGEYEKSAYIQGFNKSADAIEPLKVGQTVTVDFNITSREYNGKFYTDCTAWKVQVSGEATPAPTPTPTDNLDPLPL